MAQLSTLGHSHYIEKIMKTLCRIVEVAFVGLLTCGLLNGCAFKLTSFNCSIGPIVSGGTTYYPAHPGTTNYNNTIDYTTNPPPAGVADYVKFTVTTNVISIRFIDIKNQTNTMKIF